MQYERKSLSVLIQRALGAGIVAGLAITAAPAIAQDQDDDEAADLGRQQVTGSRILRTEVEGPSPVTIISREDLEVSSRANVADLLRELNFNSFGSFNERSGSTFQSQALVSLRGLGSNRTLVLLDGRRIPASPIAAFASADLNQLPLDAIERIEILTDSASAVYGSDAIGGVINIITRKDFTGAQIKALASRPTNAGADEENYSFTFGSEYDKGRFLISLEDFNRDPIADRDRPWSRPFDAGTGNLADTRGISPTGNTIRPVEPIPGSGLDSIPTPECDPDIFAGVFRVATGEVCGFAFADVSFLTASLDRQTMFLNADYELSQDHTLYLQSNVARTKSFGRYAPAAARFRIDADAPTNPFGVDLNLDHRFVTGGNRDSTQSSNTIGTTLGVQGILANTNYDLALRHSRTEASSFNTGLVLNSIVRQLVQDGEYNPFSPLAEGNDEALASALHTATRDIRGRFWDAQLSLSGDAFELPTGWVSWSAGAEYRQESFNDTSDLQSQAGNVLGSSGGSSGGERWGWATFAEVLIPLHDDIELTVAGRWDDFEIGGNSFSPSVAIRYTPFENLLLRASVGEGFKAPDIDTLFQAPSQSFEFATDFVQCEAAGLAPEDCPELQFETFFLNNPNLAPEKSESYNFGIVYEPIQNLVLTADVYQIQIDDVIQDIDVQTLIDLELEGIALPAGTEILRLPNGAIETITTGPVNIATRDVRGFDVRLDYNRSTDIGQFGGQLSFSRIWQWEAQNSPDADSVNFADRANFPSNRANWQFNYAYGNFRAVYSGYWIQDTFALGTTGKVPSYVQHDANVTYFAPWDAEIQVGVRNIADRGPSLSSVNQDLSRTAQDLYPVFGRVPFVSYTQRF